MMRVSGHTEDAEVAGIGRLVYGAAIITSQSAGQARRKGCCRFGQTVVDKSQYTLLARVYNLALIATGTRHSGGLSHEPVTISYQYSGDPGRFAVELPNQ